MTTIKPIKKVFIAAVFIVISFLLFSININVFAAEQGGFGGRPAYPKADNPRTSSIFIHTLEPGQSSQDGVLIVNNSNSEKNIIVYAVDSTPSTGGAFACKQLSQAKEGVGSWIALDKSIVTLKAGRSEIIPFTISAPGSASVGEHNGCIVVQEAKTETSKNKPGVSLSFRTGIRVAVTIPGELKRELEIIGFSVTKKENSKGIFLLHPLVKNLGNVSIDADVKVTTRYFFGLKHSTHGGQYPVLRGETSDWNFELKKPFWGGLYFSKFTVEYDNNPEAGVGVLSGKEKTKLKGPTVWFFSFPTILGLIIEVVILCGLFTSALMFFSARKRKKWIQKNWVLYEIQEGENINLLAKKFNVSWKLLVKVNKLKPPYDISPGQKVKTPPQKSF